MAAMDLSPSMGPGAADDAPESDPSNITPRPGKSPHRYSSFDTTLTSAYSTASPTQAKRALEAHISDTDRRIRDASKLGTNLLEQRKQLAERLKEVETQQGSEEIAPDLRQKLEDLEREYNELGRESARAFIPKARQNGGSLGTGDGSVEPIPSPTKAAVAPQLASRKQRNTSGRVEDLAFATEISTSLLGQVRHLQNVLAEKDEALKKAQGDNAKREADARYTHMRLKSLDDNEQRYKDENWHLETQVQELATQLKDAMAREQKIGIALNAVHVDKATTEREFDDLRLSHSKLTDEHTSLRKKQDTELATMRRNIAAAESDNEALQKKIVEITSQNEELARAVAYRMKTEGASRAEDEVPQQADFNDEAFLLDPSPPPSPTKGTPRHGALESETLKSSLHHAHRMIQNLKNNIHREKTEKLELRRMLQDARDEVESRRADGGISANAGKRRKPASQQDQFKKPARPDKLGSRTGPSEEIITDPTWEEYEESPSRQTAHRRLESTGFSTETSDAFETANEHDSTDAFETAESVMGDDSEGDRTETEESALQNPQARYRQMRAGSRSSFLSTASDDGEDMFDLTTPPRSDPPRYKLRMGRGGLRRSADTPDAKDSPASFVSTSSQATAKQDLAAELGDFDDGSSIATSTPGRSIYSPQSSPEEERKRDTMIRSPLAVSALRSEMVDSATLTEPWEPAGTSTISTVGSVAAGAIGGVAATVAATFGVNQASKTAEPKDDVSTERKSELDNASMVQPVKEEQKAPTPFAFSSLSSQSTEPVEPKDKFTPTPVPTASWSFSKIAMQDTEPIVPKEGDAANLENAAAARAIPTPALASLEFSAIISQSTIPIEPVLAPPVLAPSSKAETPDVAAAESVLEAPSNIQGIVPIPSLRPTEPNDTSIVKGAGLDDGDVFVDAPATTRELVESHSPNENAYNKQAIVPGAAPDEKRVPFQQVSGNRSPTRQNLTPRTMKAEGTQTVVSADQIEALMRDKGKRPMSPPPALAIARPGSSGSRTRTTAEPLPPPDFAPPRSPKRPGSAGSLRKGTASPPPMKSEMPPLPADHREVIAAASRTSSLLGNVPPPSLTPGMKTSNHQGLPRTPSGTFNRQTSPSRFANFSSVSRRPPSASARGETVSLSRRTSLSSFASEIEERFNAGRGPYQGVDGFEMSTDPRMIQAITQTMIGEFMWKYTRKAGRGEHSENRHKRFFWIHPYTRTLYWSTQDPSHSGRHELKAKSVPIEAVRVVSDDNPSPPGLHPKSIIVVTPGRNIKFTAPTGLRHETWFNALSYLLVRKNPERAEDATDQAAVYQSMRSNRGSSIRGGSVRGSVTNVNAMTGYADPSPSRERSTTLNSLTSEEVSEFNPTLHPRSASRMTSTNSYQRSPARIRSTSSFSDRNSLAVPHSVDLRNQSGRPSNATTAVASSSSTAYTSATASPTMSRGHEFSNSTSTTASTVQNEEGGVDQDGFRVPARPTSISVGLGNLSSRSRAAMGSIFGRTRSQSGARVRASHAGSSSSVALPRQSQDSYVSGATTAVPANDTDTPRVRPTVENVRACCDGRHDVGSLSHRSHLGSMSSRHSHLSH